MSEPTARVKSLTLLLSPLSSNALPSLSYCATPIMPYGCSASSARARPRKIARRSTGGKAPRRQLSTATSSGAETESDSDPEAEDSIEERAVKQRQDVSDLSFAS
jgi:hypothetical protein